MTSRLKQILACGTYAAALTLNAFSQTSGTVTTLGGTGSAGYSDGTGGVSEFNSPTALALRGDGALFIADYNNNLIRSLRLSDNRVTTFGAANHPIGLAFDTATNLYVANEADGSIVKFDYFGNVRQTYHPSAAGGAITALGIDRKNVLYIAEVNGVVVRFNPVDSSQSLLTLAPGAREIRGVTVASDGSIYVSDAASHVIWRFADAGSPAVQVAGTLNNPGSNDGEVNVGRLNRPWQIALGPNGSIVVADRGNHKIRAVSCAGVVTTLYGIDPSDWFNYPSPEVFPGWYDKTVDFAEVRDPVGVAVDIVGKIVYDTEDYYHLVRSGSGLNFPLACGGTGTGGTPTDDTTVPTPVLQPGSGFFPNGVSVTVFASNSGAGFSRDTHLYYTLDGSEPTTSSTEIPIGNDGLGHLDLTGPIDLAGLRVRAFLGTISSPVVSAQPTQVPTPVFSPDSGYYPMGVDIQITSTNGFPDGTVLRYTKDGSEPTTNSLTIPLQGNTGRLTWGAEVANRDLRSLRVKAYLGPNVGQTVSGKAPAFADDSSIQGEIGIPPARNGFNAGIGSFYILPVVVNLREKQELHSLQFVVKVTAGPGAPHLEREDVQVLPMSTNDFIQVLPASVSSPDQKIQGASDGVNRLAIAYYGTNSAFGVTAGFATVAMIGIQFRYEDALGNIAESGDTYTVELTNISGTSDGIQQLVPLRAMPDRTIRLQNITFREGDTSVAYWYNAGDFGSDSLDNGDVNSAVFAAFGFRRPFSNSDVFAAMDVYRGGLFQNVIDFADAAEILNRSLGFSSADLFRVRDEFGNWQSDTTVPAQSKLRASSFALSETPLWSSDVTISAGTVDRINPSNLASVPVYMKPKAGRSISGMQFVADVLPENGAPAIQSVQFIPSTALPPPNYFGSSVPGLGTLPNTVFARWDNLDPGITGSILLGYIQFTVPEGASAGQSYAIAFHNTGGASINWDTGALQGYFFESIRGAVWPWVAHAAALSVPDEWRQHFFGSATAADGDPASDPDGDGFSNYEEYLAGSDPSAATWHIRNQDGQFTFRWVNESGKKYTVEKTEDLSAWSAVTGEITGQDGFLEYNEPSTAANARFYRLKVQ